jgi:hypothetical protein
LTFLNVHQLEREGADLQTINDISPLAEAFPNPVLIAVVPSYLFDPVKMVVIIKNFEANDVRISNIAGTMSNGT